ncbi:hypothetical protein ACFLWX_00255 [Chloroflexota bacterium]
MSRNSLPTRSDNGNNGGKPKTSEATSRKRHRDTQKAYKPRFTRMSIEEALSMRKPNGRPKVLEEYKKYIVSLGLQEAGKFEVSSDRVGQMLRTRIKRSAAALGLDVKVRTIRNEVLFWHENGTLNHS